MSTVEEIENAIAQLAPTDYEKFRRRLVEFDNYVWDEEMKADAGRPDALAQKALADLRRAKLRSCEAQGLAEVLGIAFRPARGSSIKRPTGLCLA